MQTLRRILLVAFTIFGLAGGAGLASAAPLQGLNSAAAVVTATQAPAADAPRVEHVWWRRYYWHRYYWHPHYYHWHRWHYWHRW